MFEILIFDRSLPPSMPNCEHSLQCWKKVFWRNKRGVKVFKIRSAIVLTARVIDIENNTSSDKSERNIITKRRRRDGSSALQVKQFANFMWILQNWETGVCGAYGSLVNAASAWMVDTSQAEHAPLFCNSWYFDLSGTNSWRRGWICYRRRQRQQQRVKKGEGGEERPGSICWDFQWFSTIHIFRDSSHDGGKEGHRTGIDSAEAVNIMCFSNIPTIFLFEGDQWRAGCQDHRKCKLKNETWRHWDNFWGHSTGNNKAWLSKEVSNIPRLTILESSSFTTDGHVLLPGFKREVWRAGEGKVGAWVWCQGKGVWGLKVYLWHSFSILHSNFQWGGSTEGREGGGWEKSGGWSEKFAPKRGENYIASGKARIKFFCWSFSSQVQLETALERVSALELEAQPLKTNEVTQINYLITCRM